MKDGSCNVPHVPDAPQNVEVVQALVLEYVQVVPIGVETLVSTVALGIVVAVVKILVKTDVMAVVSQIVKPIILIGNHYLGILYKNHI